MSRKRRNTSSPEPDESSELSSPSQSPAAKRRRPSPSLYADETDEVVNTKEQPKIHAASGQVNAFPGLGQEDGESEPFYGPALNGIDYLRMVRSEAKGVPSLLRAPAGPDTDTAVAGSVLSSSDEVLGRYIDGVYTAAPVSVSVSDSRAEAASSPAAQLRYHETLIAQFRLVQATLRCTPPLEAVQALGDLRPISFPSGSKTARRAWERHVRRFDPHPVQVACMDVASVFVLVRLLRRLMVVQRMRDCAEHERRRLGAWVWAAVGKCPHRGELGSEEISTLRDLANTAATVGKGDGRDPEAQSSDYQDEEDEDEDEDDSGGVDDIGAAIEAAIQERMGEEKGCQPEGMDSTEALVDMTLTIVGEIYGQRDLLDLRPVWQRAA